MEDKHRPTVRSFRRPRPFLSFLLLVVFLYSMWRIHSGPPYTSASWDATLEGARKGWHKGDTAERPTGEKATTKTNNLVPLEAHIMSKCPDAKDCLRDLILPVMMRTHDKVNFTLSFIGRPTENDGVECRHGPSECMGNIIELCAARIYPEAKIWLGFTMCLTRDYPRIPERSLVEDCALEHAIDIKELNDCAAKDDGALGIGMLRDSVRRTSDAGVTKSCTVRLNEEIYCVRDDGEWKDCPHGPGVNDLIIAIEKLYGAQDTTLADQAPLLPQ